MGDRNILNYEFLKKKPVLLSFGIGLGVVQIIIFTIYKKKSSFFTDSFNDFYIFFNRIIVDRILIESLSVFILIFCLIKLQSVLKYGVPKNTYERFIYNLKCLPIILITIMVFTPLGVLLRYLWRNGISINEDLLLLYFGNLKNIYLQTLPPFIALSYVLINLNLSFQRDRKKEKHKETVTPENKTIEVISERGNTLIAMDDILYIEKNARIYEVKTNERVYFIRKTISELETLLSPFGFLRINRSVLANKKYIQNYSFWEFDKFILRMNDEQKTEFIVSRKRIKQLKENL